MKYGIGLDIGIESVGYSILELDSNDHPFRIERLGTRIFDKAEHPKDGSSLSAPRREARGARRRLRRHRHRLERIRGLIVSSGILTKDDLDSLYSAPVSDIYELRARALDELISPEEFARVLIHLAQRRGFKSNRKSDAKSEENGKILNAVSENAKRCIEKGYRTVGEMFYLDKEFAEFKRNKENEYKATVDRFSVEDEATKIFESQRLRGAAYASESVEKAYLDILLSQRSFAEGPACGPYSGNQVEKMRGKCTFENDELRAPKASYHFQLFNLWQHINHIRIISGGNSRPLDDIERRKIFELAHTKNEINYAHIRKCIDLPSDCIFNVVRYEKNENSEDEKKAKIKFLDIYHKIRKCVESVSKEAFSALSADDLSAIGEALCKNNSDEIIREDLIKAGIDEQVAEVLLELPNFPKFGHLSLKACKKILPFLADGLTYDKACEAAGYNFKANDTTAKMYLDPLDADDREITSPVVKRAVSQSIKVINAIIREMGTSPTYINIELARGLALNYLERGKIEKEQKNNAEINEKVVKQLLSECGVESPRGQDIVKMKLWQEQDGICVYSGEKIEISRLTEPGYVDIDHIIPYSISFDDRLANKVLVLAKENRQKRNRIPLEYLQGDERDAFIVRVNCSNLRKAKKTLLLKDHISEEAEWKQRNLQDTQFISSYIRGYIERNLLFAPLSNGKKRHVVAVNGAITSYVRKRWGIPKNRDNGDLHHAVDAVVIACITQEMVNRISNYSYYKETKESGDFRVDETTGELITKFPFPWANFRDELFIRLNQDAKTLQKLLYDVNYESYEGIDLEGIKPVFVSRMCNRKSTGAAHKETVRSPRIFESDKQLISKVSLDKLKLKDGEIEGYYNKNSDILLYEALRDRLLRFGGDAVKAFAGVEFHKPKSDGTEGPVVKKVKIMEFKSAYVNVGDSTGAAENGNIVRCDVFYVQDDGYYFIPVYVADTVKDMLPQYAPTANKAPKLMKDSDFLFSLYPNDLIRITSAKEFSLNRVNDKSALSQKLTVKQGDGLFLYYRGMDVSTCCLTGITHDNTYKHRSIGKTMLSIEKYEVDVLGTVRKVEREKRTDYSGRKNK